MALHVESVSKTLGDFSLHDISFDVKEGEYFVILGPTGAGKTIVLETIAGIHTPDTGRICWDGEDITHAEPRARNIGVVYQDYMLFPHLTVEENIGFGLRQKKMERERIREAVEKTADLLGIHSPAHPVPGHPERGRTAAGGPCPGADLKTPRPPAGRADECAGLCHARAHEKGTGRIHRLTGTTVIQITHHFEDVFALADRVAIMNNGTIVQVGEPSEVFWHPKDTFVAEFLGIGNLIKGVARRAGSLAEIVAEGGVTIVAASGDRRARGRNPACGGCDRIKSPVCLKREKLPARDRDRTRTLGKHDQDRYRCRVSPCSPSYPGELPRTGNCPGQPGICDVQGLGGPCDSGQWGIVPDRPAPQYRI